MDVRVYIFNTALPKSRVIEVFLEIFAYVEYSNIKQQYKNDPAYP